MGKKSIPGISMHVILCLHFKKLHFCSSASKPLAATHHIMC